MLSREEMVVKLKNTLTHNRFVHSLGVENCSLEMAKRYDADLRICGIAGLLHDCARDFSQNELLELAKKYPGEIPEDCMSIPILMHSFAGAIIAKEEYGVIDERILEAIRHHTLGSQDMSKESKIVCLADYIEPNRNFNGVDVLRKHAFIDLNAALLKAFDSTLRSLLSNGRRINMRLIASRNALLLDK